MISRHYSGCHPSRASMASPRWHGRATLPAAASQQETVQPAQQPRPSSSARLQSSASSRNPSKECLKEESADEAARQQRPDSSLTWVPFPETAVGDADGPAIVTGLHHHGKRPGSLPRSISSRRPCRRSSCFRSCQGRRASPARPTATARGGTWNQPAGHVGGGRAPTIQPFATAQVRLCPQTPTDGVQEQMPW